MRGHLLGFVRTLQRPLVVGMELSDLLLSGQEGLGLADHTALPLDLRRTRVPSRVARLLLPLDFQSRLQRVVAPLAGLKCQAYAH